MGRSLTCPHCGVEFGFDDWVRSASCPACGRRVSFFAASGQAEPAAAAAGSASFAGAAGAATFVAAPAAPPRRRFTTIGGKPLGWTVGWTVVLVILAIVAVGLAATRVEMGRLTALTPAERAAVEAVRQTRLSTGATNSAVLHYLATHDLLLGGEIVRGASRGTPMWYAFSRPWERTVYVSWYLPSVGLFSWTVKDGVVKPDGETRLQLAKAAQVMAHPPAANSVPAVPGIIPSIPPELQ